MTVSGNKWHELREEQMLLSFAQEGLCGAACQKVRLELQVPRASRWEPVEWYFRIIRKTEHL